MDDLMIDMDLVRGAKKNIGSVIRKTPMSLALDSKLGKNKIHFKFENRQLTGSFKIRGALNRIFNLKESEKKRGVVTASAGNHAQGVALGAQLFGVKSKIVMPRTAPLIKVFSTKSYGAEVLLHGYHFDESYKKALEISQKENRVFIHPYEDPFVIAGQATIALEILESLPLLKSIVVPIGGGGLISGIGFVVKELCLDCKVYGVVSDRAAGMMHLKKGGKQDPSSFGPTIADGIAVKNPSLRMFDRFIHPLVDDIVSVTDDEIAQAIVYAMEMEKTILEGSGAAGLAAVLSKKLVLEDSSCVLLCGGNIDLNLIGSVIDTGLKQKGRLIRFSVVVNDLPGQLAALTKDFAEAGVNILDVIHDRVSPRLFLKQTRIDFLLETMGFEHIEEVKKKIRKRDVQILDEGDSNAHIT